MSEVRDQEVPWVLANDDKCFFCRGEFPGYALKDKQGKFQAACWDCAKK